MKTLNIDKEFQALIPPLSEEEETQLKDNIIADGCMTPLVTWNGTIVDGHNRYAICTENNIEFETVEKEFADRNDVVIWIIRNQFGRRNLSMYQRAELALRMKDIFAAKAKERQIRKPVKSVQQNSVEQIMAKIPVVPRRSSENPYQYTDAVEYKLEHYRPVEQPLELRDTTRNGQIDTDEPKVLDNQRNLVPLTTQQELAIAAGVSHDTIAKVDAIKKMATPQQIRKLETNEASVNQIYKEVREAQETKEQRDARLERAEKIALQKAIERRKAAEEALKQNQRSGFARTIVNAVISDLNRISADDPEREKELDRLVEWINAARKAVQQ